MKQVTTIKNLKLDDNYFIDDNGRFKRINELCDGCIVTGSGLIKETVPVSDDTPVYQRVQTGWLQDPRNWRRV